MSQPLVFVVDDQSVIAETLAHLLRLNAYTAIAFTNPLSALSAAGDLKPDLLLSDFQMPEMNGIDLANQLLLKCPGCKVLMISGAIVQAEQHPLAGRFELLEKPLPAPYLLAKIKTTLNQTTV